MSLMRSRQVVGWVLTSIWSGTIEKATLTLHNMPTVEFDPIQDELVQKSPGLSSDIAAEKARNDQDEIYGAVNTSDSSAITGVTVETPFSVTRTLPAGMLSVGRAVKVEFLGRYSTTLLGGNMALKLKSDGITILDMPSVALGSLAQTDKSWKLEAIIVCRSEGVTGAIATHGFLSIENGNAASQKPNISNKTLSTGVSHVLSLTATPSQAAASLTLESFIITELSR